MHNPSETKILGLSVIVAALVCWVGTASATPLQGSYSVPVPTELAPYATFAVEGKMVDAREKSRVFSYDLPEELVGKKKLEILLKETGADKGLALFEGNIANAACINGKANDLLMCFVHYHSLTFSVSDTEQLLSGKYSAAEGLGGRIQVVRSFNETPGGVIRFPAVP
jgi:hypothetical protein